jgi:TM2 domain-containing membrane protein YozV
MEKRPTIFLIVIKMSKENKFCVYCGAQIDYKAEICPGCGVRQPHMLNMSMVHKIERKNPGFAAVLSIIITGLGQIYVGKIGRGLAFLVFGIIVAVSAGLAYGVGIVWLIALIIWVASAYDAYTLAKKYNLHYEKRGEPPW